MPDVGIALAKTFATDIMTNKHSTGLATYNKKQSQIFNSVDCFFTLWYNVLYGFVIRID